MFDILIRILPNNRLLVRDNRFKTSTVIRPDQLSSYVESLLEDEFEAQKAWDKKVEEIKKNDINRFDISFDGDNNE